VIENLHAGNFAESLRTTFHIQISETERLPLELIEVNELNYTPKLEQFSLIFAASLSPVLIQRLYQLEHEKLGPLRLFLVPVGPDAEGQRMRYEAAFNRLRREGA
jgi:hypothetical protein